MSDPHLEIVALAKEMFSDAPHINWGELLEPEQAWWISMANTAYQHILASLMEPSEAMVKAWANRPSGICSTQGEIKKGATGDRRALIKARARELGIEI